MAYASSADNGEALPIAYHRRYIASPAIYHPMLKMVCPWQEL